jgi:undecaprenyl-diphosphatase
VYSRSSSPSPDVGRLFGAWCIVLALAGVLTVAVEAGWTPDEAELVREVQDWAVPGQAVSDAVRAVTSTLFVLLAGAALAVMHWATGDRRAAAVLVALLVLLPVTQTAVKELVDRPRPSEVAAGIEVRASQTSPSFPAGHVMGPVVVYGWAVYRLLRFGRREPRAFLGGERQRRADDAGVEDTSATGGREGAGGRLGGLILGLPLLVLVGLTGVVSVWLGVHWPTDILGGYAWGAVLLLPAIVVREWAPRALTGDTR